MSIEIASDDYANVASVLMTDGTWHVVEGKSFVFINVFNNKEEGFSFREYVGTTCPLEVLTEGPISSLLAIRRRIKA